MSQHCEDIRPLIAELVYGEVDADTAEQIREHLGTCLSCRRYQMAFQAVREDLQEWQPEAAHEPSGITFIAPAAQAAMPLWHSRIFQGLAMAAAFFFAAFLMAAVVNLQIESGADGWVVSTSLWETPGGFEQGLEEPQRANNPVTQSPAQAQLVSLDDVPGASEWIDQQLASRGIVPATEMPMPELTDAQWEQVTRLVWDIFDAGNVERDAQAEQRFRDLVAASEAQQTETFFLTLGALADEFNADRRDDIDQIYNQMDLLYVDTDRRFDQVNNRLDALVTGQVTPPIGQQDPE